VIIAHRFIGGSTSATTRVPEGRLTIAHRFIGGNPSPASYSESLFNQPSPCGISVVQAWDHTPTKKVTLVRCSPAAISVALKHPIRNAASGVWLGVFGTVLCRIGPRLNAPKSKPC
jgi:hypothetical protein